MRDVECCAARGNPPVAKLPQGGWLLIAWWDMNGTSRFQPNQRMQLALRPNRASALAPW